MSATLAGPMCSCTIKDAPDPSLPQTPFPFLVGGFQPHHSGIWVIITGEKVQVYLEPMIIDLRGRAPSLSCGNSFTVLGEMSVFAGMSVCTRLGSLE